MASNKPSPNEKLAVEDRDGRLLFWNKLAIEEYEHGRFLTQSRQDAEKKINIVGDEVTRLILSFLRRIPN